MRHLLDHLIMLIILANYDIGAEQELEFTDVDVAKLATHTYGTGNFGIEEEHFFDILVGRTGEGVETIIDLKAIYRVIQI